MTDQDQLERKIILGDCLEVMRDMADNSVDLILTDPPYGITANKWDKPVKFMSEALRIARTVIVTASQPYTSLLVCDYRDFFKHEWIWVKNRGSNFATLKYQPMKEHESILVFSTNTPKYYPIKESRKGAGLSRTKYKYTPSNTGKRQGMGGMEMKHANHNGNNELRYPSSVQKFNCEVGLHPTQKPLRMFEYLVKTYTDEGDTVLDPFLGSGTTALACKNLNRHYIGIEINPNYVKIARERLRQGVLL